VGAGLIRALGGAFLLLAVFAVLFVGLIALTAITAEAADRSLADLDVSPRDVRAHNRAEQLTAAAAGLRLPPSDPLAVCVYSDAPICMTPAQATYLRCLAAPPGGDASRCLGHGPPHN